MLEHILGLGPLLYPFLYIGIIFLGGVILLPSIFFSIHGDSINTLYLFFAALCAGFTADSFWYILGSRTNHERLYSFRFIKKRVEEAEKFSAFFKRRGVLVTFFTKFIYGTRIASHLLAGMHKIRYGKFLLATGAGTTLWFLIFYFLIKSVDLGVDSVKATAFKIEIVLLVVTVISLSLNWFTGKYVRVKMTHKEKGQRKVRK